MEHLLHEIHAIVEEALCPTDLSSKLQAEGLTLQSFKLLSESDLKDLGFTLGPRKLLLKWFQQFVSCNNNVCEASTSVPALPSQPPMSTSGLIPPTTSNTVGLASDARPVFKGCQMSDLLIKHTKGSVNGMELEKRLRAGETYTREERLFLVKIMGRHLMQNCKEQDKPNKEEKICMVNSLMEAFPHLKSIDSPEAFYDPVSYTGHLEAYIRCRRSRNCDIVTQWTKKTSKALMNSQNHSQSDDVRILRECKPNVTNKDDLLRRMASTREDRRQWIDCAHPSITEIIRVYPRLQDMEDALKEEFDALHPTEKSLTVEWSKYKDRVLELASSRPSAKDVVSQLTNEYDEDKRTEIAFKCLLLMLPWCPRKGVKRPRTSAEVLLNQLCREFTEDETENSALSIMTSEGLLQPTLFTIGTARYLKIDSQALRLHSAGCFADALEICFKSFFVFGVAYPTDASAFFLFLERLMGVPASKKSGVVDDLWRAVTRPS